MTSTPSPKAASVSQGVPDGWKLVPIEPTDEMLDAYWEQTGESREMRARTHAYIRRYWSAMLSASPEAPSLDAAVPASGGVEAMARVIYESTEEILRPNFWKGWTLTDFDKADDRTRNVHHVMARAVLASLSPAPTSGSEAGGEGVITKEMIEAGRKAIADERQRVGLQYPDTLAILAYQAMAPLAKPASEPAGGVREALQELHDRAHDFGTFSIDDEDGDILTAWDVSVVPALVAARAALSAPASLSPAEEAQP